MKKKHKGLDVTRWRKIPIIQPALQLSFVFFISACLFAQPGPALQWDKNIRIQGDDHLTSWIETSDGYLFAGYGNAAGKVKSGSMAAKPMNSITKTDKNGNVLWTKTFGGFEDGFTTKVFPAEDGKYLLVGGKSVIKLSADGNVQWENQSLSGMTAAKSEGGYVLGKTTTVPIVHQGNKYIVPVYSVTKISLSGEKIWEKNFRGGAFKSFYMSNESLEKIIETKDGGFILIGTSNSQSGNDKSAHYGDEDVWVLKVSAKGVKEWDRSFGGNGSDNFRDFVQTPDGGYLLLAYSSSPVSGNKTESDPESRSWMVKLNSDGSKEWDKVVLDSEVEYSHISANSTGFYLTNYQYNKYITKFDWNGTKIYKDKFYKNDLFETSFFGITSDGGFITGNYLYGANPVTAIHKYYPETPKVNTTLYRAINLNSSESTLTINNVVFEGSQQAANFVAVGKVHVNRSVALSGDVDDNKLKLLQSVIAGSKTQPATFTFQNVPSGYYEVFLYATDDNTSTEFSIKVKGKNVLDYVAGGEGSWSKLGPFRTFVSDGVLDVQTSGGNANISGIELRLEQPECERAINLNSSVSLIIDNKKFEPSESASNFSYVGKTSEDQTIALNPPTDENRAKMIRSSVYSVKNASEAVLNIGTKSNGFYDVYLYVWENNLPSDFALNINGIVVDHPLAGEKGSWKKIGPYRVYVYNKQITIKSLYGEGNLSGVEIYKVGEAPTAASQFANNDSEENASKIKAFPVPLTDMLTLQLPEAIKGVLRVSLFDSYGKSYLNVSKNLQDEESIDLALPSDLPSGVYLLKLKIKNSEQIIRVSKN